MSSPKRYTRIHRLAACGRVRDFRIPSAPDLARVKELRDQPAALDRELLRYMPWKIYR